MQIIMFTTMIILISISVTLYMKYVNVRKSYKMVMDDRMSNREMQEFCLEFLDKLIISQCEYFCVNADARGNKFTESREETKKITKVICGNVYDMLSYNVKSYTLTLMTIDGLSNYILFSVEKYLAQRYVLINER